MLPVEKVIFLLLVLILLLLLLLLGLETNFLLVVAVLLHLIFLLTLESNLDPPPQSSSSTSSIRTSVDQKSILTRMRKSFNFKKQVSNEPMESQKGLLSPFSSEYLKFKSTKKCSDRILKVLKDERSRVIGLYGNKGSGKSTLVQAEWKEYHNIFSQVIFFEFSNVSSKNQVIKSIHDEVAAKLGVHFKKQHNYAQRALMINKKLESKDETVLVILDGFLESYEPRELFLPYHRNGCKVLLTTRNKSNCNSMGCDHSIHLEPLYQDEAVKLLIHLSGLHSRSPLLTVAREIASKCNCSPGLISDVVSSLNNRPIEKWKETSASLSRSTARYQIFLSFRGKDTRKSFTKPLYEALCSKGFETFMDDKSLEVGTPIDKLLNHIEESRSAIVILSNNYADAPWCLKELAKIRECEKKNQLLVLPIFYEVEPSYIKNLKGRYGEAMAKHVGKYPEEVMEWTHALSYISTLKGERYKRPQDQFIEKIVQSACDQRHRLHIQSKYMNDRPSINKPKKSFTLPKWMKFNI